MRGQNTPRPAISGRISTRNLASHRRVRVTYLPPAGSQPDALLVFVANGDTDSFAVHEVLRFRNAPSEEVTSLDLTNYEGSLGERIRAGLEAAKRAMEKYLALSFQGRVGNTFR
jgi:hypothetical protein